MEIAQTAEATGEFAKLVAGAGPVAAAVVILTVLMLATWKLVAKPAMDTFVTVSNNCKDAAGSNAQAAVSNAAAAESVRHTAEVLDRLLLRAAGGAGGAGQ